MHGCVCARALTPGGRVGAASCVHSVSMRACVRASVWAEVWRGHPHLEAPGVGGRLPSGCADRRVRTRTAPAHRCPALPSKTELSQ